MHNFVNVSEIRRFYYGEDVLNSNVGCLVDSFENSKVEFIPTFHCLIIRELRLIISKYHENVLCLEKENYRVSWVLLGSHCEAANR